MQGCGEDGFVESLLLLPFHHFRQQASARLAQRVDRGALGDAGKALAGGNFLFGLVRSCFSFREDDVHGALFGHFKALFVFFVVLFHLRRRHVRLRFDDLLLDLRGHQVQLHTQQQVRDRLS